MWVGMTRKEKPSVWTSKAWRTKGLWHSEPLSNTGSLIEPTLGLITTRRKEQRLTGRWRDSVCACVHVRQTEGERETPKKHETQGLKRDKGGNSRKSLAVVNKNR